jgi:4-amino-4-deoxychorismate lyase
MTHPEFQELPLIFESIRVENFKLQNIEYHNLRLDKSRRQLFKSEDEIRLEKIIQIPSGLSQNIHKCRVVCSSKVESIEFMPYTPRLVKSLKMVKDNQIDYSHKYLNRSEIDALFAQRGECDDILIIKNGYITDASYANVIFLERGQWLTPATPLLNGTARQRLIKEHKIAEAMIKPENLPNFSGCKLVNAMLNPDDPLNGLIQINSIEKE